MCCSKTALAFILNSPPAQAAADAQPPASSPAPASPAPSSNSNSNSATSSPASPPAPFTQQRPRKFSITMCDPENRTTAKRLSSFSTLTIRDLLSPEPATNAVMTVPGKRRKVVHCSVPDCKSRALTRKLCMRHGGGSRCQFPGCTNGAKLRNLCFQHGGCSTCLVADCENVAKRFGYCWTHGGAYVCSAPACKKFAAQGGLCWAHGGGNRCGFEGCTKRSYKQYDYRCKDHANVKEAK